MAGVDFSAINDQIEAGILTQGDVTNYLSQLEKADGLNPEEVEKLRTALKKYEDTVLKKNKQEKEKLDSFVEQISPEDFAKKEELINNSLTSKKIEENNPQMMVFDSEINSMISEYIALSTGYKAMVDGPKNLDDKMLDGAAKAEAARTEYELANSINQEYCTRQMEDVARQLETEKDPAKRSALEEKMQSLDKQIMAPIIGFADLPKDIDLKKTPESVHAYLGNKMAELQTTNQKISEKFKQTKLGKRLNNLDNKLSNSKGGKVYNVAKNVAKNAILNYGGLMACTAVLGPAGVPVYSSLKAIHMGRKAFRKAKEAKKIAREEMLRLQEQYSKLDINSKEAEEIKGKLFAAKKRANQGFLGYLKNNPHEAVGIAVSVLSAASAGYIAFDGGAALANATKLGEHFSAKTIAGAGTSVFGGVANTGVDLGKALKAKTKEERKQHLKAAAKHFTMGLATAAAGLGIGGLIKAHSAEAATVDTNNAASEAGAAASNEVDAVSGESVIVKPEAEVTLQSTGVKEELQFFAKMHPRGFNEVLGQEGKDWEVSRELLAKIEKGDIPQEKLQELLETKRSLVDEKLGYLNPDDRAAAIAAQEAKKAAKSAVEEITKGAAENSNAAPQIDNSNMTFEQQNAAYQRKTLDTVLNDSEKARLDDIAAKKAPDVNASESKAPEIKNMETKAAEVNETASKAAEVKDPEVKAAEAKAVEPKTPKEFAKAVAEGKMTKEEAYAGMRKLAEEKASTNQTPEDKSMVQSDANRSVTVEQRPLTAEEKSVQYDNYLHRQDALRARQSYGLTDKKDIEAFCAASKEVRDNGGTFIMSQNKDGTYEFKVQPAEEENSAAVKAAKGMAQTNAASKAGSAVTKTAGAAARKVAKRGGRE